MTPAALPPPALPAVSGKQPFDRASARYCHVLVRQDLPLAQQAVQAVHAAMACVHEHGGLSPGTRLVLLSVPDRPALLDWSQRLGERGIAHSLFEEPDHGIGASALATPPAPLAQRRLFGRLPLWSPALAAP